MPLQGHGVSIHSDHGFCIKSGIFRVGLQQHTCRSDGNITDLSQCDNRFDNFKSLPLAWQSSRSHISGLTFDVTNRSQFTEWRYFPHLSLRFDLSTSLSLSSLGFCKFICNSRVSFLHFRHRWIPQGEFYGIRLCPIMCHFLVNKLHFITYSNHIVRHC